MVPLSRQLGGPCEPAAEHFRNRSRGRSLPAAAAADQGLPQAFSCTIGATSYDFGVYANIDVGRERPAGDAVRPDAAERARQARRPPGYLVLRIVRQGPAGRR